MWHCVPQSSKFLKLGLGLVLNPLHIFDISVKNYQFFSEFSVQLKHVEEKLEEAKKLGDSQSKMVAQA